MHAVGHKSLRLNDLNNNICRNIKKYIREKGRQLIIPAKLQAVSVLAKP